MLQRVLFAGGGTGGHVYMAVALRDELRRLGGGSDVLFVGTERGLEAKILPSHNFPLRTIRLGGLNRVGLTQKLATLRQLPSSVLEGRRILKEFKPALVVGLGGFSSGPVMLASWLQKIPSVLIEPNIYPGLANRMAKRWVRRAAVAFEETLTYFGPKARLTGIPIRAEFFAVPPLRQQEGPVRLLIFGGSRGSTPLNRLFCDAMPHLPKHNLEVLHQTGPSDHANVRRQYQELDWEDQVVEYIEDMPEKLAWADLVLARSGASTVAELAAAGRPSILVPFPFAADDHQKKNAQALQSRGAALLAEQSATTGETLAAMIESILEERTRLPEMARAAKDMAKPHSLSAIISMMQEAAR